MSLVCLKSGLLTTVQDLGRNGFRRFGINPAGAMDTAAVRLVNLLLGNDENAPVLEMHYPAGEFVFESDVVIALGGADFGAQINDRRLNVWQRVFAAEGSQLSFAGKTEGNRMYLAVAGGFQIESWLGSSSTNLAAAAGGHEGRPIRREDSVGYRSSPASPEIGPRISTSLIPPYSSFPTIRIIEGCEYRLLTAHGRELLLGQSFAVSQDSNRMGFRLDGEPLSLAEPLEMISSAVGFGTIQLLPDGKLIILMADHQTSGGYPRLGNVISRDLPLVAQLGPGNKIAFEVVTINEAEAAVMDFERELRLLKVGVRLRNL